MYDDQAAKVHSMVVVALTSVFELVIENDV